MFIQNWFRREIRIATGLFDKKQQEETDYTQ